MSDTEDKTQFECRRCGKCCHCGSMWTGSEHPVIKALFRTWPGSFPDSDEQCAMLTIAEDGKPACLIELHLGKEYKPDTCNEYPESGDLCMGQAESEQRTETVFSESGG